MTAENSEAASAPIPLAAIAGIIATVSVFAISQGLSYPLLSFLLHRQGETPAMIGVSAAMTPLGFIISSPLIPWLSRRFGAGPLTVGCALLAAIMLTLIASTQSYWVWLPLRFLLGFFANPLYVVSETWLVAIAPADKRGRVMGIYTAIVSAGFALGPITLALLGTEGWPPFLVGICAFLTCGLILLVALPRLPTMQDEKHPTSVMGFTQLAPLLIVAVFTASAFEQSLLSLIAVYGQEYGSSEQRISTLLAVFVAGNIALQLPFGALAERIGAERTMLLCAVLAVLCCLLVPYLFASSLIWPIAFLWGAVAFGVYTMALIALGERFSGAILITGNAAFAMFWGVGGIAGPPLTGAFMGLVGVQGMPLTLGLLCGTLALCLSVSLFLRPPQHGLNRGRSVD